MIIYTQIMLSAIKDKSIYRNALAEMYREGIYRNVAVDWKIVNRAIIKRWSESGLEYM